MDLPSDALGLPDKAVGEFQIVVQPPFWSTLHVVGVYIKTASKTLIYGLMPFLHLFHEQFLFRRTHGYEYDIGLLSTYIIEQSFFLFRGLKVPVTISYNFYIGELCVKFLYRLIYYGRLAPDKIECA